MVRTQKRGRHQCGLIFALIANWALLLAELEPLHDYHQTRVCDHKSVCFGAYRIGEFLPVLKVDGIRVDHGLSFFLIDAIGTANVIYKTFDPPPLSSFCQVLVGDQF